MSLWWTRPLPAWIEPGRAALDGEAHECAAAGWREALEALEALAEARRPRALRLVLSGHFTRLAVVPWDKSLASAAERDAYLRHHFGEIYGAEAAEWAFAFDRAGPAGWRLAVAVDRALVDEARLLAGRRSLRLAAIEPFVAAELNRLRASLAHDTLFFGVLEAGRASMLLVRDGAVERVASERCAAPAERLERMVALERLEAGLAPPAAPLHVAERLAA